MAWSNMWLNIISEFQTVNKRPTYLCGWNPAIMMNGLNSSSNVSHLLLYLLRKNFDCYSTGECTKLYTCLHSYCRKIRACIGWRCWVWEKDWRHIPNYITGHILWAREPFMFWQMITSKSYPFLRFFVPSFPIYVQYCLIAVICHFVPCIMSFVTLHTVEIYTQHCVILRTPVTYLYIHQGLKGMQQNKI